jgi:hypothetical protein
MGLFCGKECKCKRRCEAGFPNDQALREGCRDACRSGDTDITPHEYMDQYLIDSPFIQNSGFDPNLDDDTNYCDLPGAQLDPLCAEVSEAPDFTPFIIAGIGIVAILIFIISRN